MSASTFLLALVALAVGAVIGWLLAQSRSHAQVPGLTAERDGARREAESLRGERDQALSGRQQAESTTSEARAAAARLEAMVEAERRRSAEQLQQLAEQQAKLVDQFKLLSAEALQANREQFLAMAGEKFAASEKQSVAELEKRERAVELMVKPLADSLGKVQQKMDDVERSRQEAYGQLREQVTTMNDNAKQLVTALRAPQVRGRWGEMQLHRVVEKAGMVEHCDFIEQETVNTSEGRLRPDLVVKLAGGKNIVIDSKVSFNGYLEASEAQDENRRLERLKAHARHLRTHVDDLARKDYAAHFEPTPEFVVMFVPAEAFLIAALEQDPTLLEHAFDRHVVIATPQTLIALLRTVAYGWKQEALASNAKQVYELGKELHTRLATMGEHLAKLGSQLNGAVKAYNQTVSSVETRVLVTARKLTELKVSDVELTAPDPIEVVARELQAAELVEDLDDATLATATWAFPEETNDTPEQAAG